MVVDDLSHTNIGSVTHVEKSKKDLLKDVQRLACLAVRLEDSSNDSFMVHHNSVSSLVVEVKYK